VVDAQGSAIVTATVTLTSIEEGTVSTTKVDERGQYLFSNVKAGTYILTMGAPTFATFTADSAQVNAAQNLRIDAKMVPGSADQTVTIEAPSATVDTRSATVAAVIDPALVQNLPVDGNNVVALTALLPGVTGVNAPTTFTNDTAGPSYIVSGSRANQNLFLFDGVLWNNVFYNTGLGFPPQFMIQEISVQLVNFKAQYGRDAGSVLNVLTRSGSSQIHGSLWEYVENSAFNARDYITHQNPGLVSNQFGATIGGPLLRDKLFYFLGYQDLRVSQVVNSVLLTSPIPANIGLNTDGTPRPCVTPAFSAAGGSCASFAANFLPGSIVVNNPPTTQSSGGIRNPLWSGNTYVSTAQQQLTSAGPNAACVAVLNSLGAAVGSGGQGIEYLPNQEVPQACFNATTLNLYHKYISLPAITTPYNETLSAKSPRNDQLGLVRMDFNLRRHVIDARFYLTNVNDATANATSPAIPTYEIDHNTAGIYNGNIGDTWVLTPNLLNVARVSYKRYAYTVSPSDGTTLSSLGSNFFQPAHVPALPRISVSFAFNLGSATTGYSYSLNAGYEADDSITWTKGNHNLMMGAQYLDLGYVHRFDQVPYFDVGGQFTTLGLADFLFGLDYSETVGNSTNIGAAEHAGYFFAQDDWRATSRLTLNLGLRYELPKPWFQPDGQSVTFSPGYQSYRFANTPASYAYQGDPGIPNSIIKTTYNNLAPRVGFAYDVFGNGRTAIRGGFGVFFDALNASTTGVGQPYHYTASYTLPYGSLSNPLAGLSPIPANYSGSRNVSFGQPYSVNFADPNVTEPYTMAVNIGFQQRLGTGTFEALYVGKFGRHQLIPYDLNPAIYDCSGAYFALNPTVYCTGASDNLASNAARVRFPGFNSGGAGVVDNNSVGTSNYNGLQVIYTQRAHGALTTTASYTYSRSMDDQSNGTTTASTLPLTPRVSTNYAPSDFQATHVFNMGWVLKLPATRYRPRVAKALLNDWLFAGIFNARTGNPFNITTTTDYELNAEPSQRPPLAPGLTHYQAGAFGKNRSRASKVNEWFNICSFSNGSVTAPQPCSTTTPWPIAPGYTNGISRNYLYGPAFIDTDLSLQRVIQLPTRGMQLRFRAEGINAFNTPNLANPVGQISGSVTSANSADHGEIESTAGKNGGVGTNGRRVQLSLQLTY
jgi:hypothetical protein